MRDVENYLRSLGRRIVRESKQRLKSENKVVSGTLLNSIKFKLEKKGKEFSLVFIMADHGQFVDKGVSGKNKRQYYKDINNKRRQSPFRYKTKQPPSSALDKWIVRRGIAPRDEKGRFLSRKSLQYLIARKIYFQGVKGISFFTTPVRIALDDAPREFSLAFKEDFKDKIAEIK